MSRATVILLAVLVIVVAGLVALSRRPAEVPLHRIEQPVTAAGADGGK